MSSLPSSVNSQVHCASGVKSFTAAVYSSGRTTWAKVNNSSRFFRMTASRISGSSSRHWWTARLRKPTIRFSRSPKSGAMMTSRTKMANESRLSFGMPRWRLRIAMLARSMAVSQARMTLRIAASWRLWLVRISAPAAVHASRARLSVAARLSSGRLRRSLTVAYACALKVFQQVAYFFAVALIATDRGALPFQDSVWLGDMKYSAFR
jgi:hypothetical protein